MSPLFHAVVNFCSTNRLFIIWNPKLGYLPNFPPQVSLLNSLYPSIIFVLNSFDSKRYTIASISVSLNFPRFSKECNGMSRKCWLPQLSIAFSKDVEAMPCDNAMRDYTFPEVPLLEKNRSSIHTLKMHELYLSHPSFYLQNKISVNLMPSFESGIVVVAPIRSVPNLRICLHARP